MLKIWYVCLVIPTSRRIKMDFIMYDSMNSVEFILLVFIALKVQLLTNQLFPWKF